MRDWEERQAYYDLQETREHEEDLYFSSGAKEATGLSFDEYQVNLAAGTEMDRVKQAAVLLEKARAEQPPVQEVEEPELPEWVETEVDAEFLEMVHGRRDLGIAQLNMFLQQARATVLERFGLAE
jgi:hypothetical protein